LPSNCSFSVAETRLHAGYNGGRHCQGTNNTATSADADTTTADAADNATEAAASVVVEVVVASFRQRCKRL
jgi:hypothetical protein